MKTISICFVCLGNICRSPTAEGVMLHLVAEAKLSDRIMVDSAGTGDWHIGQPPDDARSARPEHVVTTCRRCAAGRSAATDFERFDLLIAMDDDNAAALRRSVSAGAARQDPPADGIRDAAMTAAWSSIRISVATKASSGCSISARTPAKAC